MMYNMHNNGNTDYTKSAVRVGKFMGHLFATDMEKYILNLKEIDCIRPTIPPPRADVFILDFCENQSLIIRVMGRIHEGKSQKFKDEDQRVVLEGNGYLVLDIWWDDFDELWNGSEEEAYESLVDYFNGDREVMRE